jgi:hypothetical protein
MEPIHNNLMKLSRVTGLRSIKIYMYALKNVLMPNAEVGGREATVLRLGRVDRTNELGCG